jgi:hypothetical protein
MFKKAKLDFDTKKITTFKDKTRDYDADIIKWRGMQRDRIVNFSRLSPPDIDSLDSIFERDRKLFFIEGTFNRPLRNDLHIID